MADGLKLRCPACAHEGELPEFTQAAELLALDRAAAAFGLDWPLVKEYLDCFAGKRPMKADKRLRLAREVFRIYQAGKFEFGKVPYTVGRPEFLEAVRATCNQVTPPLTNHHYLLRVLTHAAQQTSKRREREFKEKEQGLGARGQGPEEPGPETSRAIAPEFERLVLRSLDRSLSEAERQQAKEEIRRINQERNARNRTKQTLWQPQSRRKEREEVLKRGVEQGEEDIATDLLKYAGHEAPAPEAVAAIREKLNDADWREKAGELGKAVALAKTPAARAAAEQALKAHLEEKCQQK
ncbi:MAG: hypothetical protein M1438_04810 [Deltaproteobacteria bacterium]|nr:hypothetical protein [Deltaproteobacteria bacterium]